MAGQHADREAVRWFVTQITVDLHRRAPVAFSHDFANSDAACARENSTRCMLSEGAHEGTEVGRRGRERGSGRHTLDDHMSQFDSCQGVRGAGAVPPGIERKRSWVMHRQGALRVG